MAPARHLLSLVSLAGFLLLVTLVVPGWSASTVAAIEVEGNIRVDRSSIENVLAWRVGDPWNPALITRSVKDVFALNTFSRVSIEEEVTDKGTVVHVSVKELPMILGVSISGNKALDESTLKRAQGFRSFGFFDPVNLKKEKEAITSAYRAEGYYDTKVDARVEEEERGVRIVFAVRESDKTHITELDIRGNRALGDMEIKKVMQVKEVGPLRWLSGSGVLNQDLMKDDLKRIQLLYMERGYLDAAISDPEVLVHPEGEGLYVAVTVDEGIQYRIGDIRFGGDWDGFPDFIREDVRQRTGDVFKRGALMNDIRMLENSHRDQGYAWAEIDPRMLKSPEEEKVNFTLLLNRGPLVRIRRVEISGNVKTRDYVIRREIRLLEGDLFSQKKVDDSRRFVRSLGFFDKVSIDVRRIGDDLADLIVSVEEGSSGTLTAGAAYSSIDGLVGTFSLAQSNMFGRGQRVKIDTEFGGEKSSYNLSFTEPRVLSGNYSLRLDVFDTSREYSNYDEDSVGGGLRVGYRFSDFSSLSRSYRYADYNIFNIEDTASNLIKSQEGENTTSSATLSYRYDSRDYPLDPREGYLISLSTEIAGGFLGGTNDFIRNIVEIGYFYPLYRDLIGSAHLEIGSVNAYDGNIVPVSERFFMGGLYSLRGFEYREVGPVDEDGEPLGGERSFLVNLEAAFPLVRQARIKGVVFADFGNVWDGDEKIDPGDLRYGAGFGFRWYSPMGLLRLEWGFNLDPEPGEEQPGWEFSIGALF